jgi:virulence-associated protein VapD
MQEQMFRKAREEMERELQNNGFDQTQGAYTSY